MFFMMKIRRDGNMDKIELLNMIGELRLVDKEVFKKAMLDVDKELLAIEYRLSNEWFEDDDVLEDMLMVQEGLIADSELLDTVYMELFTIDNGIIEDSIEYEMESAHLKMYDEREAFDSLWSE